MGWFDDLFKSKEVTQEPSKEGFQMKSGEALSNWATKYLGQYDPFKDYEGRFTADMTPQEMQSMDWLKKYLSDPATGENFKLAQDEYKKTMTGGYDPYNSDFYKATRAGAKYEMDDAIDAMRRGQGARGTYFQDTSMREENKMRSKGLNSLMQILGGMAETERGRRWQGVGVGKELDQYANASSLGKVAAGQTYGSLPRLIEQTELESLYQDFLRKQEAGGQAVNAAQGVFGTNMDYGVKNYETPSAFERIMGTVAPIAGQVAGAYVGNPMGSFGMGGW